MKRLYIFFVILFILSIASCSHDTPDAGGTFPTVDYSSLITEGNIKIPNSTPAITVFNLFYDKYGYGEFTLNGTGIHTESTTLMGNTIEESVTCNVTKIKIYSQDDSTEGFHTSAFYVDFYNDRNEVLTYCYDWNYHNTNGRNRKASYWYQGYNWYSVSNSWDINIKN